MKITEVAFSIYAVTDIKASRAFYEGILGLKTNSEYDGSKSENWIEYEVGKSTLSIGCSPDWKPSETGVVVALEVDDFDGFVAKLKNDKVTFFMEPQHYPTCDMAVIVDPDKNKIMIHHKKALAQ
ncbi:MAG: VOC family protein [Patescibacteria group bacterium]